MGLKPSSQASVTVFGDFDTGPKRKAKRKYYKSFKKVLKAGIGIGRRRRKIFLRQNHRQTQTLTLNPPSPGVILPNKANPMKPPSFPQEKGLKKSRHSLISYALSRLAILSSSSTSKDNNDAQNNSRQFTFHKFRRELPPPSKKSEILPKGKNCNNENSNSQRKAGLDTNNNKDLSTKKEDIVREVLSPRNSTRAKTTEELYRQNLEKFEKILAITVPTSDEDTSDYFDENMNYVGLGRIKKPSEKLSRVIATSKNRVEVDAYFLEWLSKIRSNFWGDKEGDKKDKGKSKGGKKSPGRKVKISDDNPKAQKPGNNIAVNKANVSQRSSKKGVDPNNNASKNHKSPAGSKTSSRANSTSSKASNISSKSNMTAKKVESKSKNKVQPKPIRSRSTSSASKSPSRGIPQWRNENKWDRRKSTTSHSCGGKGCFPSAPPAYLDYGGPARVGIMGKKKARDVVMERIKNVDVVEELTYMVPNGGDGDACDGEEDDDCDYYAVCESCGEMEPIPDELKRKIKGNDGKCETTPVTYSRRQRFNFKNKDDVDNDDDGPPYPYEGLQCPGCRCMCCVAGSRRNPNCNCPCCQTMGNARRCSSFDEFPVGKNPQIRRVLCPEEECKLFREECDKHVPEESGMYKYDEATESYVRQVPRTPSAIIVEVPKPRPLRKHEIHAIAAQTIRKPKVKQCDCQCQPCDPEPMYLPPMFGQCNNYPACCAPSNKNEDNESTTTGTPTTTTTSTSGTTGTTGKSS